MNGLFNLLCKALAVMGLFILFCAHQLSRLQISPQVYLSVAGTLPTIQKVQREDQNGNFIVYYRSGKQLGQLIMSVNSALEQVDRKKPELFAGTNDQLILNLPPQPSVNGLELTQINSLEGLATLEFRRLRAGLCLAVGAVMLIVGIVASRIQGSAAREER